MKTLLAYREQREVANLWGKSRLAGAEAGFWGSGRPGLCEPSLRVRLLMLT